MDAESHDGASPSVQGHSIGRWEEGCLVVDTACFLEHRSGNGYGIPSSTGKRLVERFSLDDGRESLTYRFELTDPDYLTEPVVREMRWSFRPYIEYSAEECNQENARRFLLE